MLLGTALYGQSLTVQPYLSFDWDPIFYDPGTGKTSGFEYRAFNIEQAGFKITGKLDKATVYVETRGIPGNVYNSYDGASKNQESSFTKPVYYAWGKYQLTETGNIWAGKFKPLFGPVLIDSSQFGAGWQQKIGASGHTVSGFILQPAANLNSYYPTSWLDNTPKPKSIAVEDGGIRILALEEYFAPSGKFMFAGGIAYDYLPFSSDKNDASRITIDATAAFMGIEKLTLSGEVLLAMYMQKDGFSTIGGGSDDSGFGFGFNLAAEYKVANPLAFGAGFKLADPFVGAKVSAPGDGTKATIDGSIATATASVYAKYAPAKGFYIQPQVDIKMANALNGNSYSDGKPVGVAFQLRFRWEPSITLEKPSAPATAE
jgi:hypothetical protein